MSEEDPDSDDNSSKHNNSVSNDSSSYAASGSNKSTTGMSHKGTSNRSGGIPEHILAAKETRNVKRSRIILLTVMVLSATVAATMTWHRSKEVEQDNFETQVSETRMQFIFVADCFSNILTFTVQRFRPRD
jgi:hypothetical protein